MADLREDRGQLILVTGFAIAVAVVALVLLLNTAIYTENLATRGVDTTEGDALAFRDAIEDELWTVVAGTNDPEGPDRATRVRRVDARVDRTTRLIARRHRLEAATVDVTNRSYHNGTRLVQTDANRTVTPAGTTAPNWTMATGVGDVRAAELNVTGGLTSTNDPAEGFSVAVSGSGGEEWRVYVYNDSATGTETLAVKNGTAPIEDDVCSGLVSGPPRLNLTAGTVDGTDCDALAFGTNVTAPYDAVNVRYGNRTTGTYALTVNTTLAAPQAGNFDDPPTSPYDVPVVYSLHADVHYRSATLTYRARIYAGPEEDGP
jgi:hypothetical protein